MIVSNSLFTSKIKQSDKTSRTAGCDHQLCSSIQMHHICSKRRQGIVECDHQLCNRIQAHHVNSKTARHQELPDVIISYAAASRCIMVVSTLPTRPKGIAACDHQLCDCIQVHHVNLKKARHQELPWDRQLCNNIQVHPSAGTHQSVLRCFPCYIPASLDQVGYNRLNPPATSEKHVEVLHLFRWTTHTHSRTYWLNHSVHNTEQYII